MHDLVVRDGVIVDGSGAVTYQDGTATGAMPGQLVRGPQAA